MAELVSIEVEGLREFGKALKEVDGELVKSLRKIHKEAADTVRDAARAAAGGRHKTAIGSSASPKKASITIGGGKKGDSLARFAGARKRTGWYADPRYASSRARQFRPWIGNQWDPGDRGGEPYVIGGPINRAVDEVEEDLWTAIEKLSKEAFPD